MFDLVSFLGCYFVHLLLSSSTVPLYTISIGTIVTYLSNIQVNAIDVLHRAILNVQFNLYQTSLPVVA